MFGWGRVHYDCRREIKKRRRDGNGVNQTSGKRRGKKETLADKLEQAVFSNPLKLCGAILMKEFDKIDDGILAAVTSVKIKQDGEEITEIEIKMADRLKLLELYSGKQPEVSDSNLVIEYDYGNGESVE